MCKLYRNKCHHDLEAKKHIHWVKDAISNSGNCIVPYWTSKRKKPTTTIVSWNLLCEEMLLFPVGLLPDYLTVLCTSWETSCLCEHGPTEREQFQGWCSYHCEWNHMWEMHFLEALLESLQHLISHLGCQYGVWCCVLPPGTATLHTLSPPEHR